ncbi:aminotransferase class V-fold PLP-dependent enzyme [Novosphingobium sp. BL-52-GroH]|uniref:aminotransferase class V-fold PLP-dependent enzyme n=1 Tax=Novosphingobium sp. BL-52-GroH TaxID=3349877 RepID=UPI00384E2D45
MSDIFDITAFRAQFASLPRLTYLNSGSYGLLAASVRGAMEGYLNQREQVGADWGSWVGTLETLRAKMAQVLLVSPDEVAITSSASAGMNALASALDLAARPRIVVSNFEFPTSAQIWHAQEKAGAQVVHVAESEDGLIPLEAFAAAIDERTSLVALSQVCYRNGGRIPDSDIRAICEIAHAKGALVLLDTYQIVGTTPIKARELGVDFCAGGMLKYLLGTAGVGFLYANAATTAHVIPRTTGWFAQADIDAMDIFAHTPSPTARRFEGGTPPVPSCITALAGLEVILATGLEAIDAQVAATTTYALERLAEHGIAIGSPIVAERRGPLLTIPAAHDNALVDALMARDIVTSCRDGRLRAGFHAYNDRDDADRLVGALVQNRAMIEG